MVADQEKNEHTGSDLFIDPLTGLPGEAEASAPVEEAILSDSAASLEVPAEDISPESPSDILFATPPAEEIQEQLPTSVADATAELDSMIDAALPTPEKGAADQGFGDSAPDTSGDLASPSSDQEETRAFDITIRGASDGRTRELIVGIFKQFPIEPPDPNLESKLAELGAYRVTRLSEFHAYALAVHFHRAGIDFQLSAPRLGSETAPETFSAEVESKPEMISSGAVAVALPTKPGELLLTTVSEVPGYRATQNKGVVTAHGSIARAFFREEEKQERLAHKIQSLQPRENPAKRGQMPRAEIDKVFQNLLEKLQREAFRRGANGVLGIQISGFSESTSFNPDADQIRLIATGTAALLEPTNI